MNNREIHTHHEHNQAHATHTDALPTPHETTQPGLPNKQIDQYFLDTFQENTPVYDEKTQKRNERHVERLEDNQTSIAIWCTWLPHNKHTSNKPDKQTHETRAELSKQSVTRAKELTHQADRQEERQIRKKDRQKYRKKEREKRQM
jgi:hypothetical protein